MADYKALALEARKKVLEMIFKAQISHIASNYSVIDIATVLYENLLPEDSVVWSKGWAAATIYYFLAQQGKIPKEDLEKFPNPPYLGLAETKVRGVLVSGGSMGHGLPIATGMALGKKRAGEKGIIFCIISDGELNEGTTWESAALAAHHKLNNLVVLIDANKWQAMGTTKEVLNFEPIQRVWHGFGWKVARIDGHNFDELLWAIDSWGRGDFLCRGETVELTKIAGCYFWPNHQYFPKVVICDTIKGKGVSFFENHLLYHYKHVDKEEYEKALLELNA